MNGGGPGSVREDTALGDGRSGIQMSPSPCCCPGNLVKVTDHYSWTLLLSQQVLSALGGEEEEGNQILAWDQAAVSREPVTPCGSWAQSAAEGRPAGWLCRAVCGGWRCGSFIAVEAQAC